MNQLLYLLIVLACPLMMIFMMRGMHGGGHHTMHGGAQERPTIVDTDAQDARIAELEREIARLRAEGSAGEKTAVGHPR